MLSGLVSISKPKPATCVIPAGETGKSCREFPGARPACRGTPETPAYNTGCSLRARNEVVTIYRRGCSVYGENRSV